MTAVADAGKVFVRWSDGSTSNPRADLNVTAVITVTAEFATASYLVSYTRGIGGVLIGNVAQTIEHGTDGTAVTAVAGSGYHFTRWSDGVTANPRVDTGVTHALAVSAEFALNSYTLTYAAGPGGAIDGTSPQHIVHGSDAAAVRAVADVGYRFVSWSDASSSNPRTDRDVQADRTVTASFAPLAYSVVYTAGAGGAITGADSQTVAHGADATSVTATPDTGYAFTAWSDGSTANPRTDIGLSGPISVSATFTALTYTVSYSAGSGGSLSGTAVQSVMHGNGTTAVTAVPDPGYEFDSWSDGSTANPRSEAAVTADLAVTALFALAGLPVQGVLEGNINDAGTPQPLVVKNPVASKAEYLLVVKNLGSGAALPLSVDARGNVAATPSSDTAYSDAVNTHAQTRQAQLAEFSSLHGQGAGGTPLVPPARIPAGVVPAVGDTMQLNRSPHGSCTAGAGTSGIVQAVGATVIVVSDPLNPVGGFVASDFAAMAALVDDTVFPAVTGLLGAPSDQDGNGRIVLFITGGVNELTPPSQGGFPTVTYNLRDRLPQTDCATSNAGEILYALAPDPTGSINGNVRTVSATSASSTQFRTEIAHELGHLIADSQRVDDGLAFLDGWLDEAVADSASEAAFYARSEGLAPLANIILSTLTTGPSASKRVEAFNSYANQHFSRFRIWLTSATRPGITAEELTNGSRGAATAFLRYAVDRELVESPGNQGAVFRSILGAPGTGMAALATATGTADINAWMRDFLVSAFTDDEARSGALGTTGRFAAPSWNYRSVFSGLGGVPVPERALAPDSSTALTLAPGGSASYLRFDVPAAGSTTLTLTPGAVPGMAASFTLIRLS